MLRVQDPIHHYGLSLEVYMLWIQIFEIAVESFYPEYNEYNELAQCYLNELYVH